MMEHNNSSRYNENKGKHKHHDNTKADPNKKSKVTCWKCGKPRNLKKDCKGGKASNKANGSCTNGLVDGSTNSLKGATVHMCKDRYWFKTYESLNDGSILHMGNESTALVHERGCVDLKFYVIEPNDSVLINSIIESRDAIFDENRFSSVPRPSLRISNETKDIGGSVVSKEDDPKIFDEAMKSQDVAFWKEEINDEMDSIMGNNTWVLANLPPVARISTIRLLIVMASIHNMIIHQMDVKIAFLNGNLDEECWDIKSKDFIDVVKVTAGSTKLMVPVEVSTADAS
uniref:Uncharacterized protein n=1 Tax=Tanacetum cinerariifolium TaxID=118510 RepID=A0A6L2KZP7_TANCI|nr:hypothetical protein [Tanacetum cinerariifolium]